ncbi:MAG: methyltransferase [Gammaproteobacteria bacterium]|nr:methyltransferase [Gammaproteobacteria bacterium]NNJ73239.1 methyltransferase [Enterobacterales bacterium]
MSETTFEFNGDVFTLKRYPYHNKSQLRAWDSADRYLLNETLPRLSKNTKLCILHDNFGALSTPLLSYEPVCYTDSWMSREALLLNARENQKITPEVETDVDSLVKRAHRPNLIIGRIPKFKSQLAYLLQKLNLWALDDCELLLCGMDKHLSKGQFELLEKYFGKSEFFPGVKKARVWRAIVDKNLNVAPIQFNKITIPEFELSLISAPNVFSQDKLDIGSRFFLEHYSALPDADNIADLACGNGVLGLACLRLHPESCMLFCDESFQAVQSTENNIIANMPRANTTTRVDDGLVNTETNSLDLILCNPPFHQQSTVSTDIAFNLFRSAKRALKNGGQLWIVANRHLGYHAVLKRLFGNCTTEASNKKFVILKAVK